MQPAPAAEERRERTTVWSILVLHGLTSFCYGMALPFIGIYLAGRPGIGTGGVALYYAVCGVANVVVSLLLATGAVRLSRTVLGTGGLGLLSAAFLILPFVHTLAGSTAAACAAGTGQSCFMTAIIPVVSALVPAERRRQVFARRYQILNGTLGAGSMVAGLCVAGFSRAAVPWLFVVNAAGYLPLAGTLLLARGTIRAGERRSARTGDDADGTAGPGGRAAGRPMATRGLVRISAAAALFQFGVYLFAFSQTEATAPLVADRLMHTGLSSVSVMFTINVAVIVVAQGSATRLLRGRPEEFGLRSAVALWVSGFVSVGLLSLGSGVLRLAGLMLFGVLFGLGEAAYSCSFHPWLISRVPDRELTRASALCNSAMGVGTFLGPSIGVGLLHFGSPALVWLPLAGGCALAGLSTVGGRRSAGRPGNGGPRGDADATAGRDAEPGNSGRRTAGHGATGTGAPEPQGTQ